MLVVEIHPQLVHLELERIFAHHLLQLLGISKAKLWLNHAESSLVIWDFLLLLIEYLEIGS